MECCGNATSQIAHRTNSGREMRWNIRRWLRNLRLMQFLRCLFETDNPHNRHSMNTGCAMWVKQNTSRKELWREVARSINSDDSVVM